MSQTRLLCFPQLLKMCLVERRRGKLVLEGVDGGSSYAIGVRDGNVVTAEKDGEVSIAPELVSRLAVQLFNGQVAGISFQEDDSLVATGGVILSIPSLLLIGMKAAKDIVAITTWLGDPDDELVASSSLFDILATAQLEPEEGFFISRLDQPFLVRAMLAESPIGRELTIRLLCALRFSGAIIAVHKAGPWVGDEDPFEAGPLSLPPSSAVGEEAAVDTAEIAHVCYLVEEKLRAIQSGADFYVVLEVERRAPPERIKARYRELAKMYHPDRHAQLAAFDENTKDRLEAIFGELTLAYQTLSHTREREAYDLKLTERDQKSAVQTPAPPPKPVVPDIPMPRPPRPAEAAPPRAATRSQAPPPQPPPGANRPSVEVRKAHRDDQARRPDGTPRPAQVRPAIPVPIVPPPPKAPKPRPKEAQSMDSQGSPPSGQQPAGPLPGGPPQRRRPAQLSPETLFEHGSAYMGAGEHERAVQAFSRGIEMSPDDARMHAALGTALANLHGFNKAAETSLRKAVELEPNSAELFVVLADVYQQFERPNEARTLYKRALMIDPDNADAIIALGGKPTNVEVKDFFKRLFKK